MKLYTLYATPGPDVTDFQMVGTIEAIGMYLRSTRHWAGLRNRIERTCEDVGECQVHIASRTYGLEGIWLVKAGTHLPAPAPVEADENIGSITSDPATDKYLERFPADHRPSANQAYEDGFADGQAARDEEAATAAESWEDATAKG